MKYGYNDPDFVEDRPSWTAGRVFALIIALLFLGGAWFALDAKLIMGEDWISETYDNQEWRTNEGNLPTYGAWDIETHIWKTEHAIEHFPDIQWNADWYLGMPLFEYYQYGFYVLNALVALGLGVSAARGALLLVVFGHLAATLLTFVLCYKLSRRIWVSAFASFFVLANTFISLRSYGWEPITVVFLFLFPLALLLFFKDPTRPFRLSLILVMAAAYYAHPLLFFALCMTMGLYLLSIAARKDLSEEVSHRHFLWQYFGLIGTSILLGAPQFFLQLSYEQVTSGAHMGVTYLPYYQVPFNILSPTSFFFDVGNLKGPGPVVMIAFFLLIVFAVLEWRSRKKSGKKSLWERGAQFLGGHAPASGLALVLISMVAFYYFELFNIFPMNLLRSIQYHRIIPEFIIVAAALIAALYWVARKTPNRKVFYYGMLISFVLASGFVVHGVQERWQTTDTLTDSQEWITDDFEGRISHPYTDQSLAVRSSFTDTPQVYGYYEQGITNSYADELFSASSGYHNAELTTVYLQAANVVRLYTNDEAGKRDAIVRARLDSVLEYTEQDESRYGYFTIPQPDPSPAQAVSQTAAQAVLDARPGCRELFEVEYCGSVGEEFVTKDPDEAAYLRGYVELLAQPHPAEAELKQVTPDHYRIHVTNATQDTAVIVKMTGDDDFRTTINGQETTPRSIGPDFMLFEPQRTGSYTITLNYETPTEALVGAGVAGATLLGLLAFFTLRGRLSRPSFTRFERGDMR